MIPSVLKGKAPMTPPPKDSQNHPGYAPTSMQLLGKVWSISLSFVLAAVAGALLGWLVDRYTNIRPVGVVVGVAVGLIAGGIRFVRDAKRADAEALERPGRTPPK